MLRHTPPNGWRPHLTPPEFAILEEMSHPVGNLLLERGLYVSEFPHPLHARTPKEGAFQWTEDPISLDLSNATVYIDGSASYGDMGPTFIRCDFAMLFVSKSGNLIGAGRGVPPDCVTSFAAAELWVLYYSLRHCSSIPIIITDCKGLLDAAKPGVGPSTGPQSKLARSWKMIANVLDDTARWSELASCLVWMPSHTSRDEHLNRLKSDGTPLSAIDWRANRLADANAKAAVLPYLMNWQQVAEL